MKIWRNFYHFSNVKASRLAKVLTSLQSQGTIWSSFALCSSRSTQLKIPSSQKDPSFADIFLHYSVHFLPLLAGSVVVFGQSKYAKEAAPPLHQHQISLQPISSMALYDVQLKVIAFSSQFKILRNKLQTLEDALVKQIPKSANFPKDPKDIPKLGPFGKVQKSLNKCLNVSKIYLEVLCICFNQHFNILAKQASGRISGRQSLTQIRCS